MSAVILPILYPMVTPFIAYYTLKYAASVAVDLTIDKTKRTVWNIISYPFSKKENTKCICVCVCEKCKNDQYN